MQTGIVIQLADGSYVHPRGMVENVLIKVDKLIFPADFFVLDMNENAKGPIMLVRPFMKTSRTKIDVFDGKLTMEFDGDKIEHNIHDANSMNLPSVCWIDAIIPPDKENLESDLLDDPPDVIADFSVSSDDLYAHVSPSTPVLGSCPTLLTPQSKSFVSVVEQVVGKKLKHPPERSKYGGVKKKKVKLVWRAREGPGGFG